MKVKALLVVLAMLAATLMVSWQQAPRAVACSCVALTPAEQADMADVVARGTVVLVERPARPTSSLDDATYTVELTQAWKGDPPGTVEVLTAVDGASCGWEGIEEGMEIILFAQPDGAAWRSNLCSGSGPVTEGITADLTAHLGEPTPVEPSPVEPSPGTPSAGVGLLADPAVAAGLIAALVAVGVAVWFVRRR
ncbi:hypothetical protein H5398_14630 [Tessaracoccus sp. MC1679]|uniref:hypothetical protein n=1 Tax=Tessaracoccus sp. MC1679 TaxID=2760313 RepID=UPI0016023758|nr:hypothetical protein [Tessaracoccus sp. MC1679]MBB1517189.1 hypothetical protein [Tessaracoccus sp. MC1679]